MAKIRVDLDCTIKDGSSVVFRSPCDCTAITGLIVYYIAADGKRTSKSFSLADAHGENVGDIPHLFSNNAVVKVILDVTRSMAYVQNADTNAYLEARFAELLPKTELNTAINTALAQAKSSGEFDGKDGYTPVKGKDYFDGGKGEDGYSPTVSVSKSGKVTTVSVTDKNGTKSATINDGADGKDGIDATPVVPLFVNTIAECTDTTKPYVLPDGLIYAYIATKSEGSVTPNFTNIMDNPNSYTKDGYRYSHSSAAFKAQDTDCAVVVPIPSAAGSFTIRVRGASASKVKYNTSGLYLGKDNQSFTFVISQGAYSYTVETNGDIKIVTDASAYSGGYNYIVFNVDSGVNASDLIVTVNEEITYTTTEGGISYKWANTGHAFVPANYEPRIIAVEEKASDNTARIAALESKPAGGVVTMYISPDGDDTNNGISESTPKKTVKACVEAGATHISAKRGVYKEAVNLQNIGSLEIFPTDNVKTYVVGENRQAIVFDTSDRLEVSAITSYNSIKRVAYNNAANAAYDKVFVQKTLAPIVSASQSSYHAALWLFSNDEKTVCRKPKPVLTIAECEAETNTFCYSGGYIYINADMTGVTKIIVPTIAETGFYVNGADKLSLCEVEVRFSGEYAFDLQDCAFVDLYKCSSKFTTRASGFHPVNTNGVFRSCYATKCFDGFAPNGHGHTTYIDCVSEYNFDDGMSHHSGTEGTVIGGRYEGNGKGGNTPAYGAKVNIYGGLYKNNAQFGIGYVGDASNGYVSGMVQGAVMVSNPVGLLVQANCEVTAMSCKYAGNTTEKNIQGVLTEY